jgi:hypothetical protein
MAPLGPWYVQPLFADDVSSSQGVGFANFLGALLVDPFQAEPRKSLKQPLPPVAGSVTFSSIRISACGRAPTREIHEANAPQRRGCSGAVCPKIQPALSRRLIKRYVEKPLRSRYVQGRLARGQENRAAGFRSHASFLFCSDYPKSSGCYGTQGCRNGVLSERQDAPGLNSPNLAAILTVWPSISPATAQCAGTTLRGHRKVQ